MHLALPRLLGVGREPQVLMSKLSSLHPHACASWGKSNLRVSASLTRGPSQCPLPRRASSCPRSQLAFLSIFCLKKV